MDQTRPWGTQIRSRVALHCVDGTTTGRVLVYDTSHFWGPRLLHATEFAGPTPGSPQAETVLFGALEAAGHRPDRQLHQGDGLWSARGGDHQVVAQIIPAGLGYSVTAERVSFQPAVGDWLPTVCRLEVFLDHPVTGQDGSGAELRFAVQDPLMEYHPAAGDDGLWDRADIDRWLKWAGFGTKETP